MVSFKQVKHLIELFIYNYFPHITAPSLLKNDLNVSLTPKPSEFEKPLGHENEIILSVGGSFSGSNS